MNNLKQQFQELKNLFNAGKYKECNETLTKLKILLSEANLLVPDAHGSVTDMIFTREIFEIGAYTSLRLCDTDAFARYTSHLQPYFSDPLLVSKLPLSKHQSLLTGLSLLNLLSKNCIAEFYTSLETLPRDMIENDKYVSWVIKLEQSIMEGSYDRVQKMLIECPSQEYEIYVNMIMDLVRNEIANCLEKAYPSLPLQNAVGLLFLSNINEIIEFSHKKEWLIENNRIYFPDTASESVDEMLVDDQTNCLKFGSIKTDTPCLTFVQQILGYAQELEQIV
ncbi:unnamed protein product [Pneumocystis jirovecii]|uniref:PCI domain-containing protein n=2 Tax=Pneumocystis jirovecii TaxID=42068 RepID=L0P9F5_PNEJI|nr:proteasome regulatory particle lid subunit RPN12 [Pneumocystis jirovecii RU7]KTW26278.1 hypothetical protein T551_03577 [Pneumocystis jirovecii RU7]CCJ28724.1 unnamed protein product [Pneumocystis jirovecii]